MIQITRATDYALRMVAYLAASGRDRRVSASEMSATQEIPSVFVSKILQALAQAKILATAPGRNGGAELLRAPEDISVLDVVEAVEGPVTLNRCLIRRGLCSRDQTCPIHPFWAETREMLVGALSQTKIAQFVDPPGSRRPVRSKHK
jgi:Rrf2 family protein